MTENLLLRFLVRLLVIALWLAPTGSAWAASGARLDRDSAAALVQLYEANDVARMLSKDAKAILVFPGIVKAGFMFGGAIGEGALRKRGRSVGYYNSVAASYGFQAGLQVFGYALFFMDDGSLANFENSAGFEIGVGPSVVVVDKGVGKSLTSTTVRKGIYAFIFDQKGVMAGLGVQGSKITRVSK